MMYKKLSLLLLVLWAIVFVPFVKADVQDVSFRFCDDTGNQTFLAWKKTIFVTPGKETEICLYFATSAETPRKILYGFTKWELRPQGMEVCYPDKWPNNDFSKYFTNTEERSFIIQKDKPKTIKEKILLPIGMSGMQYGCLAYSLSTLEGSGLGWMFNLVVNKVFPINLFVWNSTDIKSDIILFKNPWGTYTTNNKVKATVDAENDLKLSFLVKNQWNIGQNIQITGKVYNMLGFEKSFSVQIDNLAPGASQEVTGDVGIIPFYRWFFTVKFNISHQPKFDFDASSIDETIKQWWTLMEQAQIYIFSWITFGIIVFILAIIVKLFWPRKRIIVKK